MGDVIKFKKNEEKDLTYRLDEMSEAIADSMKNIEHVISEQEGLNALISDIDKEKRFEGFCKSLIESTNQLKSQLNELSTRKELIVKLIDKVRSDSNNKETFTLMCKAFGLFK